MGKKMYKKYNIDHSCYITPGEIHRHECLGLLKKEASLLLMLSAKLGRNWYNFIRFLYAVVTGDRTLNLPHSIWTLCQLSYMFYYYSVYIKVRPLQFFK